ncbi:MAG: hypothetical protein HQ515_15725 [Phycisphaeraceae bacterium]|nr:hypothetical protein [Phycisphaeraceae bacterium]
MTKTQARKILGISSSAGLKSAERIYRRECQKVQRHMMPGNTILERQKAQDTLLELTSAWHAMNTKPVKRPVNRKRPVRQTTAPNLPLDLAGAWDDLFAALPFPQPVVALLLMATVVMVVIFLLR